MKYTLFVSDIHLSAASPKIAGLFLHFLKYQAPKAEALYILGDLFKLWVGDDDRSEFNLKIANALKKLSTKIPVYLMAGNRDFLLGKKFVKSAGCELIKDPYKIDLYGTPTLLTHGDMLCSNEKMLQIFRWITGFSWAKKIFLSLPFKFRHWFAHAFQRHSAKTKKTKSKIKMDAVQKTIEKVMHKYNVALIIHGHTHKKLVSKKRIVLNEWHPHAKNVLAYYVSGEHRFYAIT